MSRWAWAALVMLAAVGCTSTAPNGPSPTGTTPRPAASPFPAAPAPSGTVRIAYPEEPGSWHPALTDEAAAVDLGALWGLPLYRIGPAGELRPGLVRWARVLGGDPWQVEVRLRSGRWSDGRPVVAADLAATVEALRGTPSGRGLQPLLGAEVVGTDTVRLLFDRPYGRWQHILVGAGGVLPAHVLAESGVDAFRAGVPVSGGTYRLASHEPGLRAVFEAHPDGPLGASRTQRFEVLFTPSYETALGLLRDGRVDATLGHLALNPVQRAMRVEGVNASAPLGGTWVGVRWREQGRLGGDEGRPGRVAVRAAILTRQIVQGLLGPVGEVAQATVPGIGGPWGDSTGRAAADLPSSMTLLVSRWQEATSLTVRALQQGLEAAGTTAEIVALEPDFLAAVAGEQGDGALVVHRDGPRPSLLERGPTPLAGVLAAADAAPRAGGGEARAAQQALFDHAGVLPLYRVGVAQVWSETLTGVEPSSWPGLALWDAGRWSRAGGGRAQDAA